MRYQRNTTALPSLIALLLIPPLIQACGGGAPAQAVSAFPERRPGLQAFARLSPWTPSPVAGDLEEGAPGDWVLENDQMRVVISDPAHRGGFSAGGGNILDAIPAGGEDLLREIFTYFDDTFPRQALYATLDRGPEEAGGGVSLVARGRDSVDPALEVETVYALEPGSSHLEIRTTLRNTGSVPVLEFEIGDAIEWGRAIGFGPGVGSDLAGRRPTLPFLLGYGEGAAYAWVSPGKMLSGPHGVSWSDPIVATVDLRPGESATAVRRLVVARRAGEAAALAWDGRGEELGELAVEFRGSGRSGAPARYLVRSPGGDPILAGFATEEATLPLVLPAGDVVVEIHHPARGHATTGELRILAGRRASATLRLPEPASLELRAADGFGAPCPARWTFEGLDRTPAPEFGPSYRLPGAGPYLFTPGGSLKAEVPPGRYRVTATRGPLYEAWAGEILLEPGEHLRLDATLPRLPVDETWVSADFHVHGVPSHDSPVSLADRVGSLVCEGVDWFAASDHTRRTDYEPVIAGLDLAAPLIPLVSEEVTTADLGHFGAFPLPVRADEPWNGALVPEGVTVDDIFDRLRGEGESVLIQVNHPRAGSNGYFDLLGFSAAADTGGLGFRRDFDLLEVLNGKSNPEFEKVWADWMALLAGGDPVTAVGNSDSHRIHGQEPGVPRNLVRVDPGDPGSVRERFLESVRTGRVVVTNGPFIDFTLGGTGVGGTAEATGGSVRGHIRVVAPSWVDVRRIRIYVNGREQSTFMTRGKRTPIRFDEDVEITVTRPSFVVVRVEGDDPMDPVVPGERVGGRTLPVRPLAFTNPIWIETGASRR